MRLTIKKSSINLDPKEFKNTEVSFTFLHGRKFKVGDKFLSLNEVIGAVGKEALKPGQDKNELKEWSRVFTEVSEKGYQKGDTNFFVLLIAKIKHCFSKVKRNKLLATLNQAAQSASVPNAPNQTPTTGTGKTPSQDFSEIKKLIAKEAAVDTTFKTMLEKTTTTSIEEVLLLDEYKDQALWLLSAASKEVNLSLCKQLLDKGANPDFKDPKDGATPLVWAIDQENGPLVRLLLEAGADPTIPEPSMGLSPLEFAQLQKNQDIISLLEKATLGQKNVGIPDASSQPPKAGEGKTPPQDFSVIKKLIEEEAAIDTTFKTMLDKLTSTSVKEILLSDEHKDQALWLLSAGSKDVNLDLCKQLLDKGANPNFKDPKDRATPLVCAINQANGPLVRLLLEAGADPTIPEPEMGMSPLEFAQLQKNPDINIIDLLKNATHG